MNAYDEKLLSTYVTFALYPFRSSSKTIIQLTYLFNRLRSSSKTFIQLI